MSGVREEAKARQPSTPRVTSMGFDGLTAEDGKALTKRRKDKGIKDAEANAARAQTTPDGVPAYVVTRPLLSVQADKARERPAKDRLSSRLGALEKTNAPRLRLATTVTIRAASCSVI